MGDECWTLYCVLDSKQRIYYGQSKHVEQRWKEHIKYGKGGVVREMLDEGLCFFMELETFETQEEARLTEALVIEMLPCVNKRSELLAVALDKKEYGKLYRGFRDEVFNKKGKCKYCNKLMIDRNLPRHYDSCNGIVNKYIKN